MVVQKVNKLSQLLSNEEYIDLTLSYSKISDFDRNGAVSLVRQTVVDNDGVKFGSLVDDLLFNSQEYFKENYYIFDGEKPSATLGNLCDIILKNYTELPNIQQVKQIIEHNDFWSNIKDPNKLEANFNKPEFWTYLTCKFDTVNKTVITTKEFHEAMDIVSILKEHEYSKDILYNDHDNYHQFRIEFEYKKFTIRGIIDILTIDHVNKMVYITDLKTGKNPAIEFEDSFIKWRYYFQGAIYTLASEQILRALGIRDYKLEKFQFLYISKSDKTPLVYKMTDKWISAAMNGFHINRYVYKGINELIDEIRWCWDNKEYLVPKYIVDNNGVVDIKDNFIELNE